MSKNKYQQALKYVKQERERAEDYKHYKKAQEYVEMTMGQLHNIDPNDLETSEIVTALFEAHELIRNKKKLVEQK